MSISQINNSSLFSYREVHQSLGMIMNEWVNADPYRALAKERICQFLRCSSSSLNLYNLGLSSLPDIFNDLGFNKLKKLNLSQNRLTALPESFCCLQKLQELNLGWNSLESLPLLFGDLQGLERLNLSDNKLTTLPESFYRLQKLQELHLGWNSLESLPLLFGDLQALKRLDLSKNKLTALPEPLCRLQKLQELNLGSNSLESLPLLFGDLQGLKRLYLSNNELTTLPESFYRLQALRILHLKRNELRTFPESLLQLPHDCEVDLTECGLSQNVLERLREVIQAVFYSGPRIIYSISDRRHDVEQKSVEHCLNHLYAIIDKAPKAFTKLKKTAALQSWLNRLTDTADYKSNKALQKAFAEKIIDYLTQANDDIEFRSTFYDIIEDASATCGDRVTLSILHLSIAHQLQTIDLKDMENLANFLVKGPWTLKMLETAARKKVETLPLVDEIEVYLGYPISLKEALEIPIDVKNMLYFTCSALTDKDLQETLDHVLVERNNQEKRFDFLVNDVTWQKALELNYPQDYQDILDEREKIVESNDQITSEDYIKIDDRFKQALKNLTRKALKYNSTLLGLIKA